MRRRHREYERVVCLCIPPSHPLCARHVQVRTFDYVYDLLQPFLLETTEPNADKGNRYSAKHLQKYNPLHDASET